MAAWIDFSDETFSILAGSAWGDVGVVVYDVDGRRGPSQSWMMVL